MSISQHVQTQKKTENLPRHPARNPNPPLSIHIQPASVIRRVMDDPQSLSAADVMALQRSIGNQAAGRLLRGLVPKIQAKLTVGAANDKYEQEADSVAQQVMTMPAAAAGDQSVQRLEEDVQLQALPSIQRLGDDGFEIDSGFEQKLASISSSGSPLPGEVRAYMEPRFGADFGGVVLHTDSEAAQLNRDVSAQAFTLGKDIFMGEGRYSLNSADGRQLLAHELTHVVQQGGAQVARCKIASYSPMLRTRAKVAGEECKEDQEKSKIIRRTGKKKPPSAPAWDASKQVSPKFVLNKPSPKRSNTDSSTTAGGPPGYPPTFTGHVAQEAADKKWRYQLDTVVSKGKIQIVYYTKDRYPAPTPSDDKGTLSNVKSGNWKDIVKDLKKNRTGIADFWSAYLAEDLHENYHWVDEWQAELKKELIKAEAEIAKLEVSFGDAATPEKAGKKLIPDATKTFDDAMKTAKSDWNAMGDSPGDPPYIAQAPAIDALVKRVEDYASSKKWV